MHGRRNHVFIVLDARTIVFKTCFYLYIIKVDGDCLGLKTWGWVDLIFVFSPRFMRVFKGFLGNMVILGLRIFIGARCFAQTCARTKYYVCFGV